VSILFRRLISMVQSCCKELRYLSLALVKLGSLKMGVSFLNLA